MGVPKASRGMLGRWSPEGADTYTRTYRAAAGGLQRRLAGRTQAGAGFQDFDEAAIGVELAEWLK
eukprot:11230882-Alexandrium_andersonii.AAC.1